MVDNFPTLLGETLLDAIRRAIREEIHSVMGKTTKAGETERKPYLTVKEAAAHSGLGCSTIRLLIRKKQLKAQKVGRRVVIKTIDLENFLESNPIKIMQD